MNFQIFRNFFLIFLFTNMLWGCAPPVVTIPLDGNSRSSLDSLDKEFQNQSAAKLYAPAIIRDKPLSFLPGSRSVKMPGSKIYNFPIGDTLEYVISKAVYSVFEKPGQSHEAFGIYIYLDKFKLLYSGVGQNKTAVCELNVRIKVKDTAGVSLTQKNFRANTTSAFVGTTIPQALIDAASMVGRDVVKFLSSDHIIAMAVNAYKKKHGYAAVSPPTYHAQAPPSRHTRQSLPQKYNAGTGQKWAVVAGISKYKHSGNNQIPNLRYASRDAKSVANFLKDPKGGAFDHVHEIYDEDVTYQNLRYSLFDYLGQAIEEDLVFVFFAGHGAPDPNNPQNLYLLTHDTNPQSVASSGFPMWDVETALKRNIKAETVILVTDACHSGGISGGVGTRGITVTENKTNDSLLKLAYAPGKISFTASEANEQSHESMKWGGGHGVFTHFLVQGLKGKADTNGDRIVTLGEVIDYTSENVRRATRSKQHPDTAGTFDRNLPMNIMD